MGFVVLSKVHVVSGTLSTCTSLLKSRTRCWLVPGSVMTMPGEDILSCVLRAEDNQAKVERKQMDLMFIVETNASHHNKRRQCTHSVHDNIFKLALSDAAMHP
jgi:hypothetical protein